jgi:hypothetical protein
MKMKGNKGRKQGVVLYGSYAYKALKIIAGGAALGVALTVFIAVPNLAVAAKPLLEYLADKDKRQWRREQNQLRKAIERLRKSRLVSLVTRGDETYLLISKEGREQLKRFEINTLEIKKPEEWDKRWRMVLFDIPEKRKGARNSIRRKLLDLGFYPLQKSTFVQPYDCQDEIDFIAQFFGAEKFIQYVTCDDLGANEPIVRRHFNLLLKR